MYYCHECDKTIAQNDAIFKLVVPAITSPNDSSRPAEYDGPLCPHCHGTLEDYQCSVCKIDGNDEDEILDISVPGSMLCHKCFSRNIFEEAMLEIHDAVFLALTEKFSFTDDGNTHQYVNEIIDDLFSERASLREKLSSKNESLDKKINAWLDENYDAKHRLNSVRKHLCVDNVIDCKDIFAKERYWYYLNKKSLPKVEV